MRRKPAVPSRRRRRLTTPPEIQIRSRAEERKAAVIAVVDIYGDGKQLSLFVQRRGFTKAVQKWRRIDRAFCDSQGRKTAKALKDFAAWRPFSEWMVAQGFVWLAHKRVTL